MYKMSTAVSAGATDVYWHTIGVKRIRLPPLEYSATTSVPGAEHVEDWKPDSGAEQTEPWREDVVWLYQLQK
jgi:hypothetical protein